MTPHEMLAIVHEHVAFEQAHDHESAADCYVDDGYYDYKAFGLRLNGRAAVAFNYASNYAAMPDVRFDIEGEIADGVGLIHWGTMVGTVTGPFLGQEPTGRTVSLPFSARFEFRDGRILGETLWFDAATLCDQAGLDLAQVRTAASELAAALTA